MRPVDDSEERLLQDTELLKQELARASPGRESGLMRLLAARVAMNCAFQFWGLLDARGTNWESNYASVRGAGVELGQVHGVPFWDCRWWQGAPEAQERLKDAVRHAARGEFVRYDVEILGGNRGEEIITIDFNLKPVKDRHGNVVFMIAEGRDVTEQRRLEREVARHRDELATLDRLKTEFVANVSHEFRTPLTLILGRVEDALAHPGASLSGDGLAAVRRSTLRLLRLVNTLLDFSRIEAGRLQRTFEPTDLARLTAELASPFRSLVEGAGLSLVVDCPPLPEPVYVDRAQWEKIVSNLMSNAFKFTFEGEIAVSLHPHPDHVELCVRDTGTGIPADELPRIFERFHRVHGARCRSIEGTGIGLALVQELVKVHGGAVRVSSELGRGSAFTVSVPRGHAHLPAERVAAAAVEAAPSRAGTSLHVIEASQWSPQARKGAAPGGPEARAGAAPEARAGAAPEARAGAAPGERAGAAPGERDGSVLVADDNADMRDYLVHLLSPRWSVEAVSDGRAALEAALARPPDLVVSDVMMPRLDGVSLLRELRADPRTSMVPVMLVSARAGEDAVVEGLDTGADDYLVKPFSARELLARVRTQIEMARMRRRAAEAAERERALELPRFLDAASVVLADSLDYPTTLARVAQLAVPVLADFCLVDLLDEEEGTFRRVGAACADPSQAALVEEAKRFAPALDGNREHPPTKVLIEREPLLVERFTEEHMRAIAHDEEHLQVIRAIGGRSVMCVPLARRGRLFGTLTFIAAQSGRRYSREDLAAAEELARRCALAVDNARLYKDAQSAIALRDEFLSIASHELKTPLTPLSLQIQILTRRAPELCPDKERLTWLTDRLGLVRRQGERLRRLVDNLLDISRISAGRLALELEPVRLSEIARQVVARFHEGGEIAESGSRVTVSAGDDGAGNWDRLRLEQVVDNLVSNALKYGQGKPIEIAVDSAGSSATLTIADHGIGIAPEHLGRIFGRFERAVSARHYGGLGMGLYISRRLVEALDGSIEVSSVLGEGSTFKVTLPLAGPAAALPGAGRAPGAPEAIGASGPRARAWPERHRTLLPREEGECA
ncbi:ATP-binding protein [Sorangium cellulosum]|uniref:ATP-binding protein n=1 Tax=Sorangium cellulosum TaxID=56 RepID=UPI0013ECCA9E|nr:ATP-binding protein [Sorangium cellulosum]